MCWWEGSVGATSGLQEACPVFWCLQVTGGLLTSPQPPPSELWTASVCVLTIRDSQLVLDPWLDQGGSCGHRFGA